VIVVTAEEFEAALDRHLADIRAEALELFRKDCAADKCVELAIAVLDARALQRVRGIQALRIPASMVPRKH
jgi:hypothetical protein